MSAADHLNHAEELLQEADCLWRTYNATRSLPEQLAAAEGARTAAAIAQARIALARELRISDDLPALLAADPWRKAAPAELITFPSKTAPADAPAEADHITTHHTEGNGS